MIFVIVYSRIISHITFNSTNPVMAGIGLVTVTFLKVDHVVIRENPKIIIAKPENSFDKLVKYMDAQGYTMQDHMGSAVFFENDMFEKQIITSRINRYCSIWIWN
jgi:hypothetical protein